MLTRYGALPELGEHLGTAELEGFSEGPATWPVDTAVGQPAGRRAALESRLRAMGVCGLAMTTY